MPRPPRIPPKSNHSRAHRPRGTCGECDKLIYASKDDAKRARREMTGTGQGGTNLNRKFHVYACPTGVGFHLGHSWVPTMGFNLNDPIEGDRA